MDGTGLEHVPGVVDGQPRPRGRDWPRVTQ